MLTIETLNNIEQILTSDCLTVKGNQLLAVVQVIQQVQQEKMQLTLALRAAPMPPATSRPAMVPDPEVQSK